MWLMIVRIPWDIVSMPTESLFCTKRNAFPETWKWTANMEIRRLNKMQKVPQKNSLDSNFFILVQSTDACIHFCEFVPIYFAE
jgi:hypothetical protein